MESRFARRKVELKSSHGGNEDRYPPVVPTDSPERSPRRTGRPRRDGSRALGDPTEQILTEAGRLFAEFGVHGTTMASIAAATGLRQSSLYYYFSSRDEVVAALVDRANVMPLALARQMVETSGSPAARLLLFVQGDVEALCRLPLDIGEIHRIARRGRDRFAAYWKERRTLERLLAALIQEGISAGEVRSVDPKLAALLVLGNDEGVQNWFRTGTRRRASEISRTAAEVTVGGLLAPGVSLVEVTTAAAEIGLD